jgi:starch phosphorylase
MKGYLSIDFTRCLPAIKRYPSIATELMRLLIDEHLMDWEEAWQITRKPLPPITPSSEALEKWALLSFAISPRHLEIIYEINRRFLDEVREKYPGMSRGTSFHH